MNKRTKFTIILTPGAHAYDAVKHALSDYLSAYHGGCTHINCEGAWRADAHKFKSCYEAEVLTEQSLCVWCSVMPDKAERFIDELRAYLSIVKKQHNADFGFVHIESEIVTAHHQFID
ncbi:hypothetical protein Q4561_01435 [Alteromonas sp. 1_MG-2023]|uniref:hypothetical protein n=1 Tax=Alteromonas sp. 1_MG-2023 TaxID=3062669 RepID=UPI0026E1E662|nr:hypothetical protein [Alteromonas sp. 1_MG-2023]MDO6565710.1 hypothetical protein [Alteromonas sp. 1_MG-2023]